MKKREFLRRFSGANWILNLLPESIEIFNIYLDKNNYLVIHLGIGNEIDMVQSIIERDLTIEAETEISDDINKYKQAVTISYPSIGIRLIQITDKIQFINE